MLLRQLKKKPAEDLTVVLDGAEGYGSSFLEEAFGGLIRLHLLPAEEAMHRIRIIATDPFLKTYAVEARRYMEEAAQAA